MRKICKITLALTLVSSVFQFNPHFSDQAKAQIVTDNDSSYFIMKERPSKKETKNKIVFEQDNVSVVATKKKSPNPPSETLIDSVEILNGTQKYTIKFTDQLDTINSISISPTQKFLAIQAGNLGYNKLYVVNLKDGSYKQINSIVKSSRAVETVTAYEWSPNGQKLAFSYGDPSLSRIAVYNVFYDTFTYVPRETRTISTAFILWDKKGSFIDYASEYPSDQYKLYRYSFETKQIKVIKKLDAKERTQMNTLNKY
ncbi:TolB family protein [Paenibacillus sp. Marseille-Q7038]